MSMKINEVKPAGSKMRENAHLNWMGGLSYDINDPFCRLRLMAASSFFGEPQYYHDGEKGGKKFNENSHSYQCILRAEDIKYLRDTLNALDPQEWRSMSPKEIMEKTIDECLKVDIEKTLQVAVQLRNQDNIRVTPQVIMVRAAMYEGIRGTGLIGRYAPEIIKRGDEPATQMAYFFATYGNNGKRGESVIPSRLRKAWKNALEKLDEYHLAKYRMESRVVKTIDVVRLVHANSEPINKLVKNELVLTDKTWEAIISKDGSNKASWEKALEVMPHMALLRNIRNLIDNGIDPHAFMERLVEGVANGKQLPFRYYSAYKAIGENVSPYVLDKLEECFERSFVNLPHFNGKVMSLSDNSGSAWGTATSEYGSMRVAEIGNLTSVITAKASDEGYVGIFGDRLEVKSIRQKSSIFDELNALAEIGENVGGGTETGIWLFWDKAIRNKEHWDYVFVYSDMQAGHGGLYTDSSQRPKGFVWKNSSTFVDVPKLIATYRREVNPNVQVFLVQTAGYKDMLLPEYYDKTYILGGWSGNILNFAAKMAGIIE